MIFLLGSKITKQTLSLFGRKNMANKKSPCNFFFISPQRSTPPMNHCERTNFYLSEFIFSSFFAFSKMTVNWCLISGVYDETTIFTFSPLRCPSNPRKCLFNCHLTKAETREYRLAALADHTLPAETSRLVIHARNFRKQAALCISDVSTLPQLTKIPC